MIELEQATKRYGTVTGVSGLSFRIGEGETVGLLGRNGAGKTTVLNMLSGYFPPTKGTVRIKGMDLAEHPMECRRMIGYLPEKPPLYDEMTVEEYLRFVCELREVKAGAIRAHTAEIEELCGLIPVRRRLLGQLSKGYRQRAGMAQALCGNPDILILDEPTSGLDPRQTAEMRELIRRLSAEHTIIFSSHILAEVQQVCSRSLILREGKLAGDVDLLNPPERRLLLRIAVRGENLLPALKKLPGIQEATPLPAAAQDELSCRLTLAGRDRMTEATDALFAMLAEKRFPIRELREEPASLEAVFLRMTEDPMPDGEKEEGPCGASGNGN